MLFSTARELLEKPCDRSPTDRYCEHPRACRSFFFLLRHLLKTRWALQVVWQSVEELQEAALETQTFLADASCCGQALRKDPSKADVAKDLRTLRDDLELLKEWQKELQIRKQKVQQAPGASARPTQIVQNRRGVAEGGTA